MNERIIPINRKQLWISIIVALLVLVALIGGLYYVATNWGTNTALTRTTFRAYGAVAIGIAGIVLLIYALYSQLHHLYSNEPKGLLLNSEGFHFYETKLGREVGFVKWSDIETIGLYEFYGQHIGVKLINVEQCAHRITDPHIKQTLLEHKRVFITPDVLEISVGELKDLIINEYWKRYL